MTIEVRTLHVFVDVADPGAEVKRELVGAARVISDGRGGPVVRVNKVKLLAQFKAEESYEGIAGTIRMPDADLIIEDNVQVYISTQRCSVLDA